MTVDGYSVRAYDGPTPQGGNWNELPIPFLIGNVRADVLGVAADGGLAIGEAKTANDLYSVHTRQQLRVLRSLVDYQQQSSIALYLAVPRSAVRALDIALVNVGLIGNRNVVRLHIPDCLVSKESREFA